MKHVLVVLVCLLLAVCVAVAGDPPRTFVLDGQKTGPSGRAYTEGFEGNFPPDGWTQVINCVTDSLTTWCRDTDGPYPDAYEGLVAAYIHWQYGGCRDGQDEWLKFEADLTEDNTMTFATMGSTYWTLYADFVVTVDGAPVWSFYNDFPGLSWEYQEVEIDLELYAGQTVEIGFGYVGENGADHYFDAINLFYKEPPEPPCCPCERYCFEHDFNLSDYGFSTLPCNGASVWQWGTDDLIPSVACNDTAVTYILGTVLNGAYPALSGEGAIIGPVCINEDCWCLDLCHYYDIESDYTPWDGANVKVSADYGASWTIVEPHRGYDAEIAEPCGGYYDLRCVCDEPVFHGDSVTFIRDCFDLTAFEEKEILIGFFFGSDDYDSGDIGWYIKWARIGGDEPTPVESKTWGSIKALYR